MTWIRKGVLFCMLAIVGLPLPLGLFALCGPASIQSLVVGHLFGEPPIGKPTSVTIQSLRSGEFQQAFAGWFASILFPRSLVVRLTNQAYYDLFSKSYMYWGAILVGKNAFLFEKGYVEAYCRSDHKGSAAFTYVVPRLRQLQDQLTKIGRALIFVTSPSKAVTMPELLPAGVCVRPTNPTGGLASMVAQLRGAGVSVIDGAGMTREMKLHDPIPPFPRGGTHWSNLVATRIAAATMKEIARVTDKDLGSFDMESPRFNTPPEPPDNDLALLLNLYWPPLNYATGQTDVRCRSTVDGHDTTLVAVGGSFLDGLISPLVRCGLFKEIDYYFGYSQALIRDLGSLTSSAARRTVTSPVDRKTIDWRAIVTGSTVLVIEMNEIFMSVDSPQSFVGQFLDDVIAALQ